MPLVPVKVLDPSLATLATATATTRAALRSPRRAIKDIKAAATMAIGAASRVQQEVALLILTFFLQ
jgi:hypothetical protein